MRWLLCSWLTLALPLASPRRAWAAAPLPILEGPWIDYFGYLGSPFPVDSAPELVDIDGDGDLDVFVWTRSSPGLRFFRNTGTAESAAFVADSPAEMGLAYAGVHGVFVDIDGDGDLDAFVGQPEGGDLFFFENTGSSTSPDFQFPVAKPFGIGRVDYNAMPAFVDIDGDGDLDAFVGSSHLYFFENTGTPTSPAFASPVTNPFGLESSYQWQLAPAFVDIDGDGDVDAFVGVQIRGDVYFFRNTGSAVSPAFTGPVVAPVGIPYDGRGARLSFGDLDGDGDLDAIDGNDLGSALVIPNTGTATSPAFSQANPFGLSGRFAAFADVDGDGDFDVFTEYTLQRDVGGPSSPAFGAPSPTPFSWAVPTLGDIDGDGDLDAFRPGGSEMCFHRNVGNSVSPAWAACQKKVFGITSGVVGNAALIDIDGDGDLDLFIGTASDMAWLQNTGSPTSPAFASPVTRPFGFPSIGSRPSPTFVDIDRDGDLDAVVGQDAGDILFVENTGTATSPSFAPAVRNPFGFDALSGRATVPAVVDIDGDGDYDFFVGSYYGVHFFENVQAQPVFANGFESGNTSAWSAAKSS